MTKTKEPVTPVPLERRIEDDSPSWRLVGDWYIGNLERRTNWNAMAKRKVSQKS